MANDFFNASGYPAPRAPGVSLSARNEFSAVALGFDKFPALTGNALKLLRVNAGGTAIESFADPYLTTASAAATYATIASLGSYLTTASAAATYLPLAGGTMTGAILGAIGAVGTPGYAFAADANNGWWSPAADTQAWSTAGVERMRLSAAGNVTIAVPTSGHTLTITHAAGSSTAAIITTDGTVIGVMKTVAAASLNFGTNGAHVLNLVTSDTARLAIGAAGNVTIAAPSSGSTLAVALRVDVATGATFTSANKGIRINLSNAGFSVIDGMDSTGGASYQPLAVNGSTLALQTGATDRLTISAAGNVTIAVPTSGHTLTITHAAGSSTAAIITTDGTVIGVMKTVAAASLNFGTNGAHTLNLSTNDTARLAIGAAGNVTIAAPSSGVALTVGGGGLSVTGASVLTGAVSGVTTLAIGGAMTGATTGAFSGAVTTGKITASGAALTPTSSQAFTATPTFDAALANIFEFSGAMTANVTAVTITNPTAGQTVSIRVKQDATGSRTFATPAGAKISGTVQATLSTASILTLTYSAMDARWEGSWLGLPV